MRRSQRLPDRRDLLILVLLLLLPVISFSNLFFSDKTLFLGDITRIHYPLSVFKVQSFGSGQIPLWNPYIAFGHPQVADNDWIPLHPLNLFFLLPLKAHVTLSLFIVAHFVLAGMFSYAMARSLQISKVGAFITAATYASSGYLVAQLSNLPIMTGSAWFPLVFFLLVKTFDTTRPIYAVLCGGAIALQFLATQPQIVFYSLLIVGSYGAFRLIHLWKDSKIAIQEKRGKTFLLLSLMTLAVLGGLSLAAIQIIPTWELQGLSSRAEGVSYRTVISYSLPPYNLLTFLFPNILGNPVNGYTGEKNFQELHAYVGILPLMLILWNLAKRRLDGHVAFFAILTAGSLLLALGGYTPLYHLLAHVPGFKFFRAPARWLFAVTFSLSVLAGYGFDALAASHGRSESHLFATSWKILTWVNIGITLILLACLISGEPTIQLNNLRPGLLSEQALEKIQLLVQGLTRHPLIQFSSNLSIMLSSLNPALLFVLLSNAGFLVIYIWNKRMISVAAFQVMVTSLIVVDMFVTGGTTINPVFDAAYFEDQPESITFLQENAGLYRIYPTTDKSSDMPTAYGLYAASGHYALALRRYKVFLNALDRSSALLDLAGIKYVLVKRGSDYPGYVRAHVGSYAEIYENESVLPRAFAVYHAEVMPSEQAALDYLLSDDFDPGRTVLLEESFPGLGRTGLPLERDLHEAEITFYSPKRIVVEAHLEADGFLVLSDTFYPGWKAFVDGREDRIYQADYLFRAVLLKQGEHVVEFRYSPRSLYIGFAISLTTAMVLCGIVACNLFIRRRRRT
jgi:hypothetical protein